MRRDENFDAVPDYATGGGGGGTSFDDDEAFLRDLKV